jgi:hypothetical protein
MTPDHSSLLLFPRIMYTIYIRFIGIEGDYEQIKAYDGRSFRPDLGSLGIIAGGSPGFRGGKRTASLSGTGEKDVAEDR